MPTCKRYELPRPGGPPASSSAARTPGSHFAAFEKRAGTEYGSLSPTPKQYGSFLKQISRMWATQPHITADQLETIHVPTTIADGRYDEAIKQSHDRYMADTIPNSHLLILPGVSHFAMLQNPPLFARAVLDALDAPWND